MSGGVIRFSFAGTRIYTVSRVIAEHTRSLGLSAVIYGCWNYFFARLNWFGFGDYLTTDGCTQRSQWSISGGADH